MWAFEKDASRRHAEVALTESCGENFATRAKTNVALAARWDYVMAVRDIASVEAMSRVCP